MQRDDQTMFSIPASDILRSNLAATGLNQTQFAQRTGIPRRRVSKLLAGKVLLKPIELARICRLYPLWARELRQAEAARPRSGCKPGTGRRPLPGNRQLQRLVRAPRLHLAAQKVKTRKFWPGLKRAHPKLAALFRERISTRRDLPGCLRHLERTCCDSKFELAGVLHALAGGADLCEISTHRLGFTAHPTVDRETREPVGHRPKVGYLLKREALRLLLLPQVSLQVKDGTVYTLDALALILQGRRRLWADFEVDGSGHRTSWEEERSAALGLPELRFTEEDLVDPDFLDRLWRRVEECLAR